MKRKLDELDKAILRLLQMNADLLTKEIAAKLNKPESTVYGRLYKLKKEKYILGKSTVLDPGKLGLTVKGYVNVKLSNPSADTMENFRKGLSGIKGVCFCSAMNGTYNVMLQIITTDNISFGLLCQKIATLENVVDIVHNMEVGEIIPNKGLDF